MQVSALENKGAEAKGDASPLQILIWAWLTVLRNFLTRDAAEALPQRTWGNDIKWVGPGEMNY